MPESLLRDFTQKETLALVFSCDVCEISKNSFFSRTRLVATSENAIFETEFKNLLISSENDVPFSRYLLGYIFENIF